MSLLSSQHVFFSSPLRREILFPLLVARGILYIEATYTFDSYHGKILLAEVLITASYFACGKS